MNKIIIIAVILLLMMPIFFLYGPSLFFALSMEFDPNKYRTEEISSLVKKKLKEKYREEFIIDKTEYNAGLSGFYSKAYPVNKHYLNFKVYVPDYSNDQMYEEYSIIKEVNKSLFDQFNRNQYYYEMYTGALYGRNSTEETKISDFTGQIAVSTVENIVDIDETFKKMDEVIFKLKKEGVNHFGLILLVVKKPYTLKTLESEIFKDSTNGVIIKLQNTNKIALECRYRDGVSKPPFSSTCKNK